jgi:ribose transport system ATP-binding protein
MANPAPIPLLQMQGIEKSFPGVRALDGVDFDVNRGEVHALMGENGAGKSTLMKILAGVYTADSGQISINGEVVQLKTPQRAMKLGIQIIYQEFNLVPHLTVAENIFLGHMPQKAAGWVDRRTMRGKASQMLADLDVHLDPDVLVGGLSNAQKQFVEIAKATSQDALVIAMDEPSATLTEHEQVSLWELVGRLRKNGVGIIYISHRMDEVFKLADRITILRDGKTVATHQASDIDSDTLVREMVGRPLGENFPDRTLIDAIESAKPPLLEVRGLSRKGVLTDVSFSIKAGEIVALAGMVGAGRTEIARCLFGADPLTSGEIYLDGKRFIPRSPQAAIRAGIGFVTEDRKGEGLVLQLSVSENVSLAALDKVSNAGMLSAKLERAAADKYVESLNIHTPSTQQIVMNLSGGNQQKVALAKWLFRNTRLLILDEPTRGIDVGAKTEIYRLINDLASEGIGILMISSELPEVIGMADRIIVIRLGQVAGEIPRIDATQEAVARLALGA